MQLYLFFFLFVNFPYITSQEYKMLSVYYTIITNSYNLFMENSDYIRRIPNHHDRALFVVRLWLVWQFPAHMISGLIRSELSRSLSEKVYNFSTLLLFMTEIRDET